VLSYQIVRQLESEKNRQTRGADLTKASKALGELYWLGISSLVTGASTLVSSEMDEAMEGSSE